MPVNQWELQSHFMDANMFNATLGRVYMTCSRF